MRENTLRVGEIDCLGTRLKQDFPLLAGSDVVFLDSAASAQKPEVVISAVSDFYSKSNANIHRGVYPLSVDASEQYDQARCAVASFIGASQSEEVVFTRGATEAINLVAHSFGRSFSAGDEILLTVLEHHSNIVPWQLLAERSGAVIKFVSLREDGSLDIEDLKSKLSERTKLVSVTHLANAIGIAVPVAEVIEAAHAVGAKVLVDAAQAISHMPIDVRALDVDFLVFSGHKLYGPTGIGVLYGKYELLDAMPPFEGGGDMIFSVRQDGSDYADVPARFEAGTPHIAGAVGLAAAIRYVSSISWDEIEAHEARITSLLEDGFRFVPEARVLGAAGLHRGSVSCVFESLAALDIAEYLGKEGICVRAGHHCAEPLHRFLGAPASLRASIGLYTTEDDIARFFIGLDAAISFFSRKR